eukprot:g60007.t1
MEPHIFLVPFPSQQQERPADTSAYAFYPLVISRMRDERERTHRIACCLMQRTCMSYGGLGKRGLSPDATGEKRFKTGSDSYKGNFKTRTCKFFGQGACTKGTECPFIHEAPGQGIGGPSRYGEYEARPPAYSPYAPPTPEGPYGAAPPGPYGYPDDAAPAVGGKRMGPPGSEYESGYGAYPPYDDYYGGPRGYGGAPPPYSYGGPPSYGPPPPFGRGPYGARGPRPPMPYKYKTQNCKFFSEQKCTKGTNCPFIHPGTDPVTPFKVRPCKFFQEGRCTRGKNCTFKHEGVTPASGSSSAGGGEQTNGEAAATNST